MRVAVATGKPLGLLLDPTITRRRQSSSHSSSAPVHERGWHGVVGGVATQSTRRQTVSSSTPLSLQELANEATEIEQSIPASGASTGSKSRKAPHFSRPITHELLPSEQRAFSTLETKGRRSSSIERTINLGGDSKQAPAPRRASSISRILRSSATTASGVDSDSKRASMSGSNRAVSASASTSTSANPRPAFRPSTSKSSVLSTLFGSIPIQGGPSPTAPSALIRRASWAGANVLQQRQSVVVSEKEQTSLQKQPFRRLISPSVHKPLPHQRSGAKHEMLVTEKRKSVLMTTPAEENSRQISGITLNASSSSSSSSKKAIEPDLLMERDANGLVVPVSPLKELLRSRSPDRECERDKDKDKHREKARDVDRGPGTSPRTGVPDYFRAFARDRSSNEAELARLRSWLQAAGLGSIEADLIAGGVTKLSVLELLTAHDLLSLGLSESATSELLQRIRALSSSTLNVSEAAMRSASPPPLPSPTTLPNKVLPPQPPNVVADAARRASPPRNKSPSVVPSAAAVAQLDASQRTVLSTRIKKPRVVSSPPRVRSPAPNQVATSAVPQAQTVQTVSAPAAPGAAASSSTLYALIAKALTPNKPTPSSSSSSLSSSSKKREPLFTPPQQQPPRAVNSATRASTTALQGILMKAFDEGNCDFFLLAWRTAIVADNNAAVVGTRALLDYSLLLYFSLWALKVGDPGAASLRLLQLDSLVESIKCSSMPESAVIRTAPEWLYSSLPRTPRPLVTAPFDNLLRDFEAFSASVRARLVDFLALVKEIPTKSLDTSNGGSAVRGWVAHGPALSGAGYGGYMNNGGRKLRSPAPTRQPSLQDQLKTYNKKLHIQQAKFAVEEALKVDRQRIEQQSPCFDSSFGSPASSAASPDCNAPTQVLSRQDEFSL